MQLKDKVAIVFGAGGSLGSAVAKQMAEAGACVICTGHRLASVQAVSDAICDRDGVAEAMEVDALEEDAVTHCVSTFYQKYGSIDVAFNAISLEDTQDVPLIEMKVEDFLRPIERAMRSQFITSRACARRMIDKQSGVILTLTATPGGIGYPNVGGFGPACSAVESFTRNLAAELGPFGVRAVNIRSAGSPDSRVFKEAIEQGGKEGQEFIEKLKADSMLKQMPTMADVANVAVFLASDSASKITGVTVDVTCGTTAALNYKVGPIPFTN